jgi:hypothetical protein
VDGPADSPHERSAEHIARHSGGPAEGQVKGEKGGGGLSHMRVHRHKIIFTRA